LLILTSTLGRCGRRLPNVAEVPAYRERWSTFSFPLPKFETKQSLASAVRNLLGAPRACAE
jgi:hypothetical protein